VSLTTGRIPFRTKFFVGFGAVAFGVKDAGFSFFLLIFYNQVLGVPASQVGAALGLALIVDALVDPLIGYLSDRTYTRWGRRLPWLYLAPLPLAVVWVVLWNPPGGGVPGFWELFGTCVLLRLLLSACEVPEVSLVPEITADYDERTTLFRYRYLMGWLGGLLMLVMAYSVFMTGPKKILERGGYTGWSYVGAAVIVISVMGAAAGLHRLVAGYPAAKPGPFSWARAFDEIREAFSERAFLIFAGGALAAYVSQGLTVSLSQYVNAFVWRFNTLAFQLYPAALAVSVLIMFVIVSPLHRRFGKARTAETAAYFAFAFAMAPYALLLAGLWPEPGTTQSTALYFAFLVAGNTSAIVIVISASSMVAEIVEAFQERTGRRAEGSFYSGNWLVQKSATGMGIFLSGQIVGIAGLPAEAVPGEVASGTIDTMILLYVGVTTILTVGAAWFLGRFPITREDHERRVAKLAAASRASPETVIT
jgi:GPH family glycoside/pentoside/hexuronide:cation symporter